MDWVCVWAQKNTYIHTYIYIYRERERDTHRDREIDIYIPDDDALGVYDEGMTR